MILDFLKPVSQLLQTNQLDQLINQIHFKYPLDGVHFPLHQDAWNRRHGTDLWQDSHVDGSYIQVVLTIDRMIENNGPLVVIPKSQKLGPLTGENKHLQVENFAQRNPPIPLLAEPGTLIFFGPFLNTWQQPKPKPSIKKSSY